MVYPIIPQKISYVRADRLPGQRNIQPTAPTVPPVQRIIPPRPQLRMHFRRERTVQKPIPPPPPPSVQKAIPPRPQLYMHFKYKSVTTQIPEQRTNIIMKKPPVKNYAPRYQPYPTLPIIPQKMSYVRNDKLPIRSNDQSSRLHISKNQQSNFIVKGRK